MCQNDSWDLKERTEIEWNDDEWERWHDKIITLWTRKKRSGSLGGKKVFI